MFWALHTSVTLVYAKYVIYIYMFTQYVHNANNHSCAHTMKRTHTLTGASCTIGICFSTLCETSTNQNQRHTNERRAARSAVRAGRQTAAETEEGRERTGRGGGAGNTIRETPHKGVLCTRCVCVRRCYATTSVVRSTMTRGAREYYF